MPKNSRKKQENRSTSLEGTGISTRHELINEFARKRDVPYEDAKSIVKEEPTKMTPPHKKQEIIADIVGGYGSLSNFRQALTVA